MPENGEKYVTNARLHDKLDEVYESIDEVRIEQAKQATLLRILLIVAPAAGIFGADVARALT